MAALSSISTWEPRAAARPSGAQMVAGSSTAQISSPAPRLRPHQWSRVAGGFDSSQTPAVRGARVSSWSAWGGAPSDHRATGSIPRLTASRVGRLPASARPG
jgi:hypothetical protein